MVTALTSSRRCSRAAPAASPYSTRSGRCSSGRRRSSRATGTRPGTAAPGVQGALAAGSPLGQPGGAGRRAGQHARAAGGYQRGRSRAAAGHRDRPGGRVGNPVLLGPHRRYPVPGGLLGDALARIEPVLSAWSGQPPRARHGHGKLSSSRARRTSHPGPVTSSRACSIAPTTATALHALIGCGRKARLPKRGSQPHQKPRRVPAVPNDVPGSRPRPHPDMVGVPFYQ